MIQLVYANVDDENQWLTLLMLNHLSPRSLTQIVISAQDNTL